MLNLMMRVLIGVLAIGGMVDSYLALRVHNLMPGEAPPCAITERFDCGTVNTSRFSYFPPRTFDEDPKSNKVHVPVATIGILGYGLMLLLAMLGRWWALLQFAEIGFGAATLLTYLEAFVIEKWCIYCLWSQAIVTSIVLTTIVALVVRKRESRRLETPSRISEQRG